MKKKSLKNNTNLPFYLGGIILLSVAFNITQALVYSQKMGTQNSNENIESATLPAISPSLEAPITTTEDSNAFDGDILFNDLPICNYLNRDSLDGPIELTQNSHIYNDGKVELLNEFETHSHNGVGRVTICKNIIIGPNKRLAATTPEKSIYPMSYIPDLKLFLVQNNNTLPPYDFFDIKKQKVITANLPKLIGNAIWSMDILESDDYAYILYHPGILGGCGTGKEGDKCFADLYKELKIFMKNNGVYILRSDGKQITVNKSATFLKSSPKLNIKYGDTEAGPHALQITSDDERIIYWETPDKDAIFK